MSDDQKPNLNPKIMSDIMDGLAQHMKQVRAMGRDRPDDFHLLMTRGENLPPLACGHEGRWGFNPGAPIHGVQVVISEHVPPDTMILMSRPPDQIMRPDWPSISVNPKEGFNEHAPTWEPDFNSLLRAAGHQLISTNRGHFNTIICADDSPIIPERPRVCWTCGQTFMSRRAASADRQCLACVNLFIAKRHELHCDLEQIFYQTLYRELRRLNKPCPNPNSLPEPPFKSVSQQRQEARAAKARARRKALRLRKRSGVTQQTA